MSRMIDSNENTPTGSPSGQTTPEVAVEEWADEAFTRHYDDDPAGLTTDLAMTTTHGNASSERLPKALFDLSPGGSINLPKPGRPTLLGLPLRMKGAISLASLTGPWVGHSGPAEDQSVGTIHRTDLVLDQVLRHFQSGHPSMKVRLVREDNQDGSGAWTSFAGHKSYKVRYMFEDEASGLKVLRPVTMTVSCCTRPLLDPNGLKSETGEEEARSEIKLYLGWNKELSAVPPGYDTMGTRGLGFPGPPIAEGEVDEVHPWPRKTSTEKDSDPEKVAFHIGLPTVLGVPSHGDKTVVFATEPVAVYDGDLDMKGDDKRMTGLEDASADSVYLQVTITADTSELTAAEADHAREHQAESDAIWKALTHAHQSGKEIDYRGLSAAGATQGIDHLMGVSTAAESEPGARDGNISLLGPGYAKNYTYMQEQSEKPGNDSEVKFHAPPPRVARSIRLTHNLARKAGGRSVQDVFDKAQTAKETSEISEEVAPPSMWREGSEFAPSATVTTTKLHGQQRREPSTINPHWLTSKQARQEEDESAAPDADQTGDQAATTLFGYLVSVERERVAEEAKELSQRYIHEFKSTEEAGSMIPAFTADDLTVGFGDMTIDDEVFNQFDDPPQSTSAD